MFLPVSFQSAVAEAGCDEAGRGCYAGPVFAAAVILPENFHHPLLNDSKQVNKKNRFLLKEIILKDAITYGVAQVGVTEIDASNILKASQKAMHLAISQLKPVPKFLSIDGNYFIPYKKIQHQCFVKGDGRFANIAAASILAKTFRDEYMENLHHQFPAYSWITNMGYGTLAHRKAIEKYGLTAHHRKSFNILPRQLNLY